MFVGNPSFVSGQGWVARKTKRLRGETAIRRGRCLFAHSPVRRFADSGTHVTAEDAASAEASVYVLAEVPLPWVSLWELHSAWLLRLVLHSV